MDNVVELPVVTTLPIPCERVLRKAIEASLGEVLVIGMVEDGSLYFAGSHGEIGNALWLLERAKNELLRTTT